MSPLLRLPALTLALLAVACESYSPAPVDLAAHELAFAGRLPDAPEVVAFAARLREHAPGGPEFDLRDGLSLEEARLVSLLFHPDLRTARLRAGVAAAGADEAGRWDDPTLALDVARILESVEEPWILAGALSITVPLTGRHGLERELASTEHGAALVEARIAEARVLDELDRAWTRWSGARVRAEIVQELLDRLRDLEAIAARLAQAQEITRPAARAFTLERIAREAAAIRADAAVREGELHLKELLGLSPTAAVELVPTLSLAARAVDPDRRPSLLVGGPRVALQRVRHDVAERALELAVDEQWPQLTLLPTYHEEDGMPRAGFGVAFPLPLWNGNARAIAEARAARELAAEDLRCGLERALQELARAELRLEAARRERAMVELQLVPLAEQQAADGHRLAELGQLDTLLLLDGLLRAYDAKSAALDAALAEADGTAAVNALFWPNPTTDERPESRR